jgi:hypothetical protein
VTAVQETARDPSAVASALERVFERPELRSAEDDEASQWLEGLLEILDGDGLVGDLAGWVLLILAGMSLGFLAVWVARQFRGTGGQGRALARAAPAPAGTAAPVDEWLELRRRAREARERGELALALRLSFAALLVGLGRAGGLQYRDAWTARELLARGRPAPELAAALGPLVEGIDARTFGSTPVSAADLDQVEQLSARWVERGEVAR